VFQPVSDMFIPTEQKLVNTFDTENVKYLKIKGYDVFRIDLSYCYLYNIEFEIYIQREATLRQTHS